MERNYGFIFKTARNTAGLTQERWAECLGLSVDAIQNYEQGRNFPTEETVLLMADISGSKILAYQYLSLKSRIAEEILPPLIDGVTLPKAVLQLLQVFEEFKNETLPDLVKMAADGRISPDETEDFLYCIEKLDDLTRRLYSVKYAKEDP